MFQTIPCEFPGFGGFLGEDGLYVLLNDFRPFLRREGVLPFLVEFGVHPPVESEPFGKEPKGGEVALQLRDPKQKSDRPWAALAAGLYGRFQDIARGSLTDRLSSGWDETRDPAQRGAFALGLGLLGALSMGRDLRAEMLQTSDEVLAGQLAVALGLLDYREANGDLRELALREGASAGLRLDAGTGLRLMDDPLASRQLGASYADAGNLARREGLAAALAMLSRSDVLEPLDDVATDAAMDTGSRSSACAALGRLAEKTLLPWNAMLLADCPAAESPGDIAALLASAY